VLSCRSWGHVRQPKINVRELYEDLDQYARRLRIKEYFHSKKETSEDLSTDESNIKEVIHLDDGICL
jgi:hypothetical protein